MRVAVFADVHGDIWALRALLADIDAAGIERIWCLGDFVFERYSSTPAPVECFDLVTERAEVVLAGNWEWFVSRQWAASNLEESLARYHQIEQLGGARLQQILRLEPYRALPELGIELAHASLAGPLTTDVRDVTSAERCLAKATQPLVIVGHTHIACFYRESPDGYVESVSKRVGVTYSLEGRCVLNPGAGREGHKHNRRGNATHARWLELALDPNEPTAMWHRVPVP